MISAGKLYNNQFLQIMLYARIFFSYEKVEILLLKEKTQLFVKRIFYIKMASANYEHVPAFSRKHCRSDQKHSQSEA